ncbi:hypothetical protein ACSVDE_14750 [Pseudalkalibacillus sp. Hm43]|uniref:hypothetical protein n=1 Tax=Pseudalkalibacillus sp. Hm43 TaxID=3450742 RepID=UPI003F432A2F
MKCYMHNDLDVIVQCHGCGKGLCKECADRFEAILCEQCLLSNNVSAKSSAKKSLIIAGVLFILGFNFGLSSSFMAAVIWGYILAGVPLGWKAVNKITPNFILILPIMGWVIFFVYKFVVSAAIGIFMTPFHIKRMINEIKISKTTNEQVAAGKM